MNMYNITRDVGIEIECSFDNDDDRNNAENDILGAKEAHEGVKIETSGDGSVRGYGLEVKVRGQGEALEKAVTQVCALLSEYGGEVNKTTGLHVHVNTPELAPQEVVSLSAREGWRRVKVNASQVRGDTDLSILTQYIKNGGRGYSHSDARGDYWPLYTRASASTIDGYINRDATRGYSERLHGAIQYLAAIEPVIRAITPKTRRDNQYCKPLTSVAKMGGKVSNDIGQVFYDVSERYAGINLLALRRHGTVEFRYHSGSLEPEKILAWAELCVAIIGRAVSQRNEAEALSRVVDVQSRAEALFTTLDYTQERASYFFERMKKFADDDKDMVAGIIGSRTLVCAA